MSDFYSGGGDDGLTGLLGEGRVPKDHPRPAAYGEIDEASAVLGVARSMLEEDLETLLLKIQRDLYHLMAEIAAVPAEAGKFRVIGEDQVKWLEGRIAHYEEQVVSPSGFVIPGDSSAGAYLHHARTVVRRAERAVVHLQRHEELANPHLLVYLNRLSSLCFLLALVLDQRAGRDSPTMADGSGG